MSVPCPHLDQLRAVTAHPPTGCEECLKTGDWWVTCGSA